MQKVYKGLQLHIDSVNICVLELVILMSGFLLSIVLLVVSSLSAYAHTVHNFSFANGLVHPVFGPDHFLAMLSVGIVSALIGGAAIWRVPSVFVLSMIIGGGLGMLDLDMFAMDAGLIEYYISDLIVEIAIGLSVFLFGLSIFWIHVIGERLAWTLVFSFGLFHGYAHGMEIPPGALPLYYVAGFVVGTTGIHLSGLSIGWLSRKFNRLLSLLRVCGVFSVVAGVYFVFSALRQISAHVY